jgi:gliding motility-associated-like protein
VIIVKRGLLLVILFWSLLYTGVKAQVNAQFSASFLSGCPPLLVNFNDLSTGGVNQWAWDFDGNGTSTLQFPSTSFNSPGLYNVRLVATNTGNGSTDTAFLTIRVFQPPIANFMAPDRYGCIPPCHTVNFVNQTLPGESPITQFIWDFGGSLGTSQQFQPSFCYNQIGNFDVTLLVSDSNGCTASLTRPNYVVIGSQPNAAFTPSATQSCTSPLNVSFNNTSSSSTSPLTYQWSFGGGANSTAQNPNHVYFNGIFDPQLVVTDTIGCTDTATAHIEVTQVTADFSADQTAACIGQAVNFTDLTTFASSWSWNFGDAGTSTQQNPSHTYNAAGTYTVTLTVTYNGCTDTETKTAYITVTPPVTGNFTSTDPTNCTAPWQVTFTANAGAGATSYQWNFGDNTTGTGATATHNYTANGTYTVTLGIQNAQGCVFNVTQTNLVSVGPPTANFSVSNTMGCAPLAVNFTNTSTSATPVTTYAWVFGDGGTASTANPSHTYNTAGTYNPTLTITNSAGCTDNYTFNQIDVGTGVVANFTAFPTVICNNQTVTFTNTSTGVGPGTTYSWSFGDGSTATTASPNHLYSDTGQFTVQLTVMRNGCVDSFSILNLVTVNPPKADFMPDFDCFNPLTVQFNDTSIAPTSWFWDFGDASSSTLQDPAHTYAANGTYDVTLIVSNINTGCVDSITKPITIGPPNATFSADTTQGCRPLTVQFADSSTFASAWAWDFGDGSPIVFGQTPTHTYQDTGRYTVKLIINPGDPCADSVIIPNMITVFGVYSNIGITPPNTGCSPLTVSFNGSATIFGGGSITTWRWTFGDGDSAQIQNPSHVYTTNLASQAFQVRLRVTDSNGCTAQTTYNSAATVTNAVADFIADTILCPGELDSFFNISLGNNSYQWDFGDGVTSTLNSPTHAYPNFGTYTVRLVATNGQGCTDTTYKQISVTQPVANFSSSATDGFASCPPFPVQFTNLSNRPDFQCIWYFADGDTSTAQNPLHVYFTAGRFDVKLVIFDPVTGCNDSITLQDTVVINGPFGNWNVTPTAGCVPLDVQITGTLTNASNWIADLGDGTVLNNQVNINHTYNSVDSFFINFVLTDSTGCTVPYNVALVDVGEIPYPNLSDTSVCKGNYVQYNLQSGDTFVWTVTDLATGNPCLNCLSCYDCANPLFTGLDTMLVTVTATTYLGCTASDAFTIYVDALPQILPGTNFKICNGESIQLNAGNVSAATWSGTLQSPQDIQYMNDTNLVSPTVNTSGLVAPDTLRFRVTGTNTLGCAISRLVQVYLIDQVVATLNTLDTIICEGESVQLNLDVNQASWNDTAFSWQPTQYLNNATVEDPIATPPTGDYTYTVTVSSPGCNDATASVNISVKEQPQLEAGDDQTITKGTQIQLYASSAESGLVYGWTTVFSDSLSCYDCRRPYITPTQSQTVYVSATNQYGCAANDSVVLKVVGCDPESVFVPNTFTPNDDGLNDKLFVRGIDLKLEYFNVFDRWGRMVFTTDNIAQGWDGIIGSKKGDAGTYVYVMKAVCTNGNTVEKSGNVTMIK